MGPGRSRRLRRAAVALGIALAITALVAVVHRWEPESRFERRAALPSCGHVELRPFEDVPTSAWECLDAAGDTGAELQVTTPTTEGDPTHAYYRVGPGIDGLEIFYDTTADTYGTGTWRYVVCPGTDSAAEPTSCH